MPSSKPPAFLTHRSETSLQAAFIKWLKAQGAIAWKLEQSASTQAARPDVIFLKEGFWGAIEFKKSKTARFRPGQKQMVEKLNNWSWCKVVYPENEKEIKEELLKWLK